MKCTYWITRDRNGNLEFVGYCSRADVTVRHRQNDQQPWLYRCAQHAGILDPKVCTIEPIR